MRDKIVVFYLPRELEQDLIDFLKNGALIYLPS